MRNNIRNQSLKQWQRAIHEVIFEAETPAGKRFDIILIICITLSVVIVMLDSVASIRERYESLFHGLEWLFTALFTIEYIFRMMCIGRPMKYAGSFFGIVDLLAILPTYVSLFFPGSHYLAVVRILRVLRIFRVLKLIQYLGEATMLVKALRASLHKITIFVSTVMTLVVILGSVMYLVEGEANGFTSIPKSIYWAIVTVTTVGYGDFSPQTSLGQAIAAIAMIMGYSIIAVPTGIITVELSEAFRKKTIVQACPLFRRVHSAARKDTKTMPCFANSVAENCERAYQGKPRSSEGANPPVQPMPLIRSQRDPLYLFNRGLSSYSTLR